MSDRRGTFELWRTFGEAKRLGKYLAFVWTGAKGSFKTLTLQTLFYPAVAGRDFSLRGQVNGLSVAYCNTLLDLPDQPVDVCLLDDIGSKVYKRSYGSRTNIEWVKNLQEAREITPIMVATCPNLDKLDKDMCEVFLEVPLIGAGTFILLGVRYFIRPANDLEYYRTMKRIEKESKAGLYAERVRRIKSSA